MSEEEFFALELGTLIRANRRVQTIPGRDLFIFIKAELRTSPALLDSSTVMVSMLYIDDLKQVDWLYWFQNSPWLNFEFFHV